MVQCEYFSLLELHLKMEKIMKYLKVDPQVNQASISQDNIVNFLNKDIDSILMSLIASAESKEDTQKDESEAMYSTIQKQLQRQENLNRLLIRRELQFKEYQKCVLEELDQEKLAVKTLQNQIDFANAKIAAKEVEQQATQKKLTGKDNKYKDFYTLETIINEKKLGNPLKNTKEIVGLLHQRRRSQDLLKRSASAMVKKRPFLMKK